MHRYARSTRDLFRRALGHSTPHQSRRCYAFQACSTSEILHDYIQRTMTQTHSPSLGLLGSRPSYQSSRPQIHRALTTLSLSLQNPSTVTMTTVDDRLQQGKDDTDSSSSPQVATKVKAKRSNKNWTKEDDEFLFNARQRGVSWKQLSATMKRPVGSIFTRYYRVLDPFLEDAVEDDPESQETARRAIEETQRILEANVPSKTVKRVKDTKGKLLFYNVQGPWTARDRERLIQMVQDNVPWTVITQELQRNIDSCKEKWSRIQRKRVEKRRQASKQASRHQNEQTIRLQKEGFNTHHRDQLVRAVERHLAPKKKASDSLDFLGDAEDSSAFALMMLHQDADSVPSRSESIDWDVIAKALHNKFPANRLKSIYQELAAAKLIWTPEEDERLMQAVVRLGPPQLQPSIWTTIKRAFGEVYRSAEDYKNRWRTLDMPLLEREWDLSEKQKFWRRWLEYQEKDSLFSHAGFNGVEALDGNSALGGESSSKLDAQSNMWDQIAEGLEFRHGRDCEEYFRTTTQLYPRDPDTFDYLTREVAKSFLEPPRTANWTPAASKMLIATVNSYLQAGQVISWPNVANTFGGRYTVDQCKSRWTYWKQGQQAQEAEATADDPFKVVLESSPEESKSPTSTLRRPWSDQELELLKKGVDEFGQQWTKIQDAFLPHRSIQMLHERYWRDQSKKKGRFSEKERQQLEMAIETCGEDSDWDQIASHVPGRSASQCRKAWKYGRSHHIQVSEDRWTDQDLQRLRSAVAKFGTTKWGLVSEFVVGKTAAACRMEWREKLDPALSSAPWTDDELGRLMDRVGDIIGQKEAEEMAQLEKAEGQEGPAKGLQVAPRFKGRRKLDWEEVARGMKGRTARQCRVRFLAHRKLYRMDL